MTMETYTKDVGEGSQSIGSLIQQSAGALENECSILEATVEEKSKVLQGLIETCSRQAENIAKQQADLEQLKVKTHLEELKNQAHLSKIYEQRNELQAVEKHFVALQKTINPMLACAEELDSIIDKLKLKNEEDEIYVSKLEQEYKFYEEQADKALFELQERKDQEKQMMNDAIQKSREQLEQIKQTEAETSQFLREKQRELEAKEIIIRMSERDNSQQREQLIRLQQDLAAENEHGKIRRNELEHKLAGENSKKSKLLAKIEETDQKTNVMNVTIEENEMKIKNLESEYKQLKSKEENYKEIARNTLMELEEMQSTLEKLEEENNRLISLEKENLALKTKFEELNNTNENYKTEIAKIDQEEEFYRKEIDMLNSSIKEAEVKRECIINEQLGIENRIEELQKELRNDNNEHRLLSSQIDKESTALKNDNERLNSTMLHLKELILEAREDKKNTETFFESLEKELYQARINSEKSDLALFNFYEKTSTLTKTYNEENKMLDDLITESKEDYNKTVSDGTKNEDMKVLIVKLQADLEIKRQHYDKTIQQMQESFQKEIEEKSKKRADIAVQYETEFRNKELLKTDALVDLKEINTRIADMQEQMTQAEKENQLILDKLSRYDNLISKLEGKLNKVAQVAVTSSQSEANFDNKSQASNLFAKSVTSTQRNFPPRSPGSDSSGKTIDLEKIKNRRRKKASQNSTLFVKPNPVPKKTFVVPPQPKKNPSPSSKKTTKKVDEDWGWSE